jgi:hypothetical protein
MQPCTQPFIVYSLACSRLSHVAFHAAVHAAFHAAVHAAFHAAVHAAFHAAVHAAMHIPLRGDYQGHIIEERIFASVITCSR